MSCWIAAIGASSEVADTVQIHEIAVVDGTTKMQEIKGGLPISGGGSVVLKPGSYHVMMFGLRKPLATGEIIPVTLRFEKAGVVAIAVPVTAVEAQQNGRKWAI